MLRNGVAAVLGPSSATTSSHIQSICDALEIPHVETQCHSRLHRAQYAINLHPHPSSLSKVIGELLFIYLYPLLTFLVLKAYFDIVRGWNWTHFAILYEDEDALGRLQHLLKVSTMPGHKVSVRKLPQTDNYR